MAVDVLDLMALPDARPMNRDLEEWAQERGGVAADAGTSSARRGPCRDCGKPAEATCIKCASATCSRHYRVMYGLCLHCSPDVEDEDDAGRPDLDIPWIG